MQHLAWKQSRAKAAGDCSRPEVKGALLACQEVKFRHYYVPPVLHPRPKDSDFECPAHASCTVTVNRTSLCVASLQQLTADAACKHCLQQTPTPAYLCMLFNFGSTLHVLPFAVNMTEGCLQCLVRDNITQRQEHKNQQSDVTTSCCACSKCTRPSRSFGITCKWSNIHCTGSKDKAIVFRFCYAKVCWVDVWL